MLLITFFLKIVVDKIYHHLQQQMSSILRHVLKQYHFGLCWSVLLTFVTTLIVYSIKKVHESYWYPSSIAYQEKRTDWILRIFTYNDKNPLYLPIISTFHFFEGQGDQEVLVIKPCRSFQNFPKFFQELTGSQ